MRKPTLFRYYGLFVLMILAALIAATFYITARSLKSRELQKWGYEGIGALCIGISGLVRGLDFLILCDKYPLYLREKAKWWDTRAKNLSPFVLAFLGIWFVFIGGVLTYTGAKTLIATITSLT